MVQLFMFLLFNQLINLYLFRKPELFVPNLPFFGPQGVACHKGDEFFGADLWLCRIDKDQTSSAHGEPKADVHNIA